MNSENLTIDVSASLLPNNIYVDGGYINFIGKNLIVGGETKIENSGFLTTDMFNFTTNSLLTLSGVYVARTGWSATI